MPTTILPQLIAAAQALKATTPTPAMVPEGASPPTPPHDYSGKGGLLGRLFPDRDPNTGEQGGILANPLFRMGLNLVARSGPQARPHSLGQDIAGSVGDYADQRDTALGMQDKALGMFGKKQAWNDLQGKEAFGQGLDMESIMGLVQGVNPAGDPSAIRAQGGTPTIGASANYKNNLRGLESGGNPNAQSKLSSASGPYQFIDSTRAWIDQQAGFNPSDRSPETDSKRLDVFTDFNVKYLQQAGLPANDTTLYAAHLLGGAGAKRFLEALKANPNTPAEAAIDPEQVAKNQKVLAGKTVGQVYDLIDRSISKGAWDFNPANAGNLQRPQPAVVPTPQPQVAAPQGPAPMVAAGPPPAPAQFPPSPGQAPATAPPTPLLPSASSPAVPQGPQGAAVPQAQSPAGVGGPTTGPGGPVTGSPPPPTIPEGVLQVNDKGSFTKSSMLDALKSLPPQVRNAVIIGSWMKAAGNKREFAQNLGESLISMTEKSIARAGTTKPYTNIKTVWDTDANGKPVQVLKGLTPEGDYETIPGFEGRTASASATPPINTSDPNVQAGVKAMADAYRLTGRLPRSVGTEMVQAVMAEVGRSQLEDKASTTSDILRQLNLKSDQSAITPLKRQLATANAFITTMERNMDVVKKLAPAGGTDIMPWLAKYTQWGRDKVLASPDVPAYAASLITVMDEYAKILSGATGGAMSTDSMRAQVFSMLDTASTNAQVEHVFETVIRPDGENRRQGYQIAIDQLSGDQAAQADLHGKGTTGAQPKQWIKNGDRRAYSTDGGNTWIDEKTGKPI